MKYYLCSSCGATNGEKEKYCIKCGTYLIEAKLATRRTKAAQWVIPTVIGVLLIMGFLVSQNFTPTYQSLDYAEFGRDNPADLGRFVEVELLQNNLNFLVRMAVHQVVRGEEALRVVEAANMLNPSPHENHEYLLAEIEVQALSGGDGAYLQVSDMWFTLVSENGMDYNRFFVVPPEPALIGNIYPGASVRGWAVFMVSIEDKNPVLASIRDTAGRGGIWFKTINDENPPTSEGFYFT